ncbi:DUF5082 domain-containing protein [Bacillus haynesii]|uniref:DUF5082 domain-containing protein n=1 Tax=Bacillus haynesii TaxID=1925021 RepID=UPI002281CF35|nr:DUF5082 domain-containing protein [Bacillus haynesii]MCY7771752.1 DUF5082 domain-containing protein [Bacillus haynesii]MCY8014311.1 DUF5082 domain-containing protein [Bacillus haynesii]MCY9373491.1 DUF5082 domain-containing protein [Bacillus haynesii]MEC0721518.1 DUF5082 domain-containing protein [Bacillus haynesii]MEC0764445.1 DUF5082 domain-containing protein [Bacillus haynesii]
MSHKSTLDNIQSAISQNLTDIENKIDKLMDAKKEIQTEHADGIVEIRQILNPHLDQHWTGKFAADFDKERDEAHTSMHDIVNEKYLDYIATIEREILQLKSNKAFYEGLGITAGVADSLIKQGEKVADELNDTINSIKKKLGW